MQIKSHHEWASDERQQVSAHGQEDQHAVKVQDSRWSPGPSQSRLGGRINVINVYEIHPWRFHQVSPDAFTYPQEMPGVEELLPQIVKKVKPDKKEYVDAHPDYL